MWTFLGIASFTYLYKKLDTALSVTPPELWAAAAVLLAAGLLLSFSRCSDPHKPGVSLLLRLASSLPVIKHVVPGWSARSGRDPAEGRQVTPDWKTSPSLPLGFDRVLIYYYYL